MPLKLKISDLPQSLVPGVRICSTRTSEPVNIFLSWINPKGGLPDWSKSLRARVLNYANKNNPVELSLNLGDPQMWFIDAQESFVRNAIARAIGQVYGWPTNTTAPVFHPSDFENPLGENCWELIDYAMPYGQDPRQLVFSPIPREGAITLPALSELTLESPDIDYCPDGSPFLWNYALVTVGRWAAMTRGDK